MEINNKYISTEAFENFFFISVFFPLQNFIENKRGG